MTAQARTFMAASIRSSDLTLMKRYTLRRSIQEPCLST